MNDIKTRRRRRAEARQTPSAIKQQTKTFERETLPKQSSESSSKYTLDQADFSHHPLGEKAAEILREAHELLNTPFLSQRRLTPLRPLAEREATTLQSTAEEASGSKGPEEVLDVKLSQQPPSLSPVKAVKAVKAVKVFQPAVAPAQQTPQHHDEKHNNTHKKNHKLSSQLQNNRKQSSNPNPSLKPRETEQTDRRQTEHHRELLEQDDQKRSPSAGNDDDKTLLLNATGDTDRKEKQTYDMNHENTDEQEREKELVQSHDEDVCSEERLEMSHEPGSYASDLSETTCEHDEHEENTHEHENILKSYKFQKFFKRSSLVIERALESSKTYICTYIYICMFVSFSLSLALSLSVCVCMYMYYCFLYYCSVCNISYRAIMTLITLVTLLITLLMIV